MKLLIYQWNSYFQYDIYEICKESNIIFEVFSWTFQSKNEDEKFEQWFEEHMDCRAFDALLSVNYWPLLAQVCHRHGIKYIAWCYDCPLNVEKIEETLGHPTNHVFFFDRMQFQKYRQAGFETVYHLPMGVNSTRLRNLQISKEEYERYEAQVSFIGNLYNSRLQEILAPMNDYTRGYLKAVMDLQSQIYGYYFFDEVISEEFIQDINSQYLEKEPDTKFQLSREALTFAMASEITRQDRIILLNLCGRRYHTKFYSYEDSELIKNVEKCKALDYISEMPKMFFCSKINLNPSLRIIQSGIPLRALDIMGAGGFLLSNYQEELVELYENEKEMVVYESIEDALEKAEFYLRNEDIRLKIAENGRKKTLEQHSLQQCMKTIFEISGL